MKTRKALNIPGHAHELTSSCYRRLPLLNRERTRRWLLEALEHTRQTHAVDLWAYVIMPEHVHVIVNPRQAVYQIEEVLRTLKQSLARRALGWLRDHEPGFLRHLAGERAGWRRRRQIGLGRAPGSTRGWTGSS